MSNRKIAVKYVLFYEKENWHRRLPQFSIHTIRKKIPEVGDYIQYLFIYYLRTNDHLYLQ